MRVSFFIFSLLSDQMLSRFISLPFCMTCSSLLFVCYVSDWSESFVIFSSVDPRTSSVMRKRTEIIEWDSQPYSLQLIYVSVNASEIYVMRLLKRLFRVNNHARLYWQSLYSLTSLWHCLLHRKEQLEHEDIQVCDCSCCRKIDVHFGSLSIASFYPLVFHVWASSYSKLCLSF